MSRTANEEASLFAKRGGLFGWFSEIENISTFTLDTALASVSKIHLKEKNKINNLKPLCSPPLFYSSYFNQLSEGFVHLVQNAGGIMYEILDRVQVIERDQQNVFGPRAQQHLVFEGHSHEVI